MAKSNVIFAGDEIVVKVKDGFEKHISKHIKAWDIDTIITLCHGRYELLPQDMDFDKFYIFINILPRVFDGIAPNKVPYWKINGSKLTLPDKKDQPGIVGDQGNSLKFAKAPEDAFVIKDEEDQPLAAIYDGSLYFMSDFIHSLNPSHLEIACKIFDYVIDKAINETKLLEHLKADAEVRAKRTLELALKSQFTTRLDKESIQLKAAKDTIEAFTKNIVDAERKLIAGERIIEAIQRNIADVPTALEKVWSAIYRLRGGPLYENVSFTKSGVRGITTNVYIDHNSNKYDMGKFEVTMFFNGETVIKSVTGAKGSIDHPHVNSGKPCWGNMAGSLPKLIGASEFDVAFVMVHRFLSSYDHNSPYKKLEEWPTVKEKAKEEPKKASK